MKGNISLFKSKHLIAPILDLGFFAFSYFFAFYLRFEGKVPEDYLQTFYNTLPFVLLVKFGCFLFFDVYKGLWRYASIDDLLNILKALLLSLVLITLGMVFLRGLQEYPRSVFVMDFLLTLVVVGGSRFSIRVLKEYHVFSRPSVAQRPTLIVGASDAGMAILREIKNNLDLEHKPVGFVDEDKVKLGMNLQGVPVLGSYEDIPRLVRQKGVEEIIIALPSATRYQMRSLLKECEKTQAKIKIVPSLADVIDGTVSIRQIREVKIEDLLGREIVEIDTEEVSKYLKGKRILVTGAGGSIGSEICRQILPFQPEELLLFGRGENSIYEIHQNLKERKLQVPLVAIIGDVINLPKLQKLFERFKPQIVFHAAANKHVPLMESNVDEAILSNIIGTRNILLVSDQHGVERSVCISTDKAADPISIMGMTKKVSEMLVEMRKSRHHETRAVAVRFGNVLGSRGSVIPLFQRQILKGGPLTITHPEVARYFMTISEAAKLVLQAGAIGNNGDIFLLDMGEQVKIVDLAKEMVSLSGLRPGVDIDIEFIGLRPGEKIKETLYGQDEALLPTSHPKISLLVSQRLNQDNLMDELMILEKKALDMNYESLLEELKNLVSHSQPQGLPRGA